MGNNMYMCDFETTTNPHDCRVWAACAVSLEDGKTAHLSNNLETFMAWVMSGENKKLYFHNLGFDAEFLLPWLFNNGYTYYEPKTLPSGYKERAIPNKTFTTIIDDMGQFYMLHICFERKGKRVKKCEIYDSYKKLPDKAKNIAKEYGLPMSKGKIDYTANRPIGYEPTDEEKDYIETDCKIIQMALNYQFDEGMKKMTVAGDAFGYLKEMLGRKYEYWFPVLPKMLDDDLRKAYKGGYTYCNPKWANKDIGEGIVLDVNSLYPDAMYSNPLPYGYPVYFEGKYEPNNDYTLYISRIRCAFRLKPDHLPTIQIRGGNLWQESEYLTSSELIIDGHPDLMRVDLTLTCVDLELFLNHYDVYDLEYINGFMFRAQEDMFKGYIDHWMEEKANNPKGSYKRAIAKLYLNSCYGRFAMGTERLNKIPVMCPDGVIRYYCHNEPEKDRKGNVQFDEYGRIKYKRDEDGDLVPRKVEEVDAVYTPVAAFVTAFARKKTIEAAQAVYDRFLYCDTDSLHLIGTELPEGLEVHPTNLGAWDHEKTFTRARFLRAKTYIEEVDGVLEVTCAGMPDEVKYPQEGEPKGTKHPTWDNFKPGAKFPGKLLPKRVKGGIVLDPVVFTIKL